MIINLVITDKYEVLTTYQVLAKRLRADSDLYLPLSRIPRPISYVSMPSSLLAYPKLRAK